MKYAHFPPRVRLRLSSVALIALVMTGCNPSNTQTTPNTNTPHATSNPSDFHFSTNNSLNYGRESAQLRFMSQYWRVVAINDIPVNNESYLDLRKLPTGHGALYARPNCAPILLEIKTDSLSRGDFFVEEIERTITDCSNEFEDHLMSIMANIKTFSRNKDGSATIISYEDIVVLRPAT